MNFKQIYEKSVKKPGEFWREVADDVFWFKKSTISDFMKLILENLFLRLIFNLSTPVIFLKHR